MNYGNTFNEQREYLRWLEGQVCRGDPRRRNYSLLLGAMHKTPFMWVHPMDANRAADGISLRSRFLLEHGYFDVEDPVRECSVLEMLVALCIRVEREIMGCPGDDHPEKWFWEIIGNLGMLGLSDDMFEQTEYETRINTFLERKYRRNGVGGAFPIETSKRDLRSLDIWAQMNAWLVYNHPSEVG